MAGAAKITCPASRWKQARFAGSDVKVVQLHLALRPGQRRGARECGGVAVFVDAVEKRLATWLAAIVQKATRTVAPGATRMRRRMEKMGSRTAPTEFESGRLSMIAIGARTVWPRPRKRALSVSNSGAPDSLAVNDGQMRGPDFGIARAIAFAASPGWRRHREDIPSRRTASKRRDARRRRSEARARVRRRT